MTKIRVFSSLLLLVGISVQAQIIIPGPNPQVPFQQLKAYLGLTDTQVSQIVLNLNDYGRLVSQRQQRMFQVQGEIQQETAKSPLDPAGLGVRYAEIETICRNVKDEAIAAQNRNLGLLNDTQKAKLKVLEDAIKLFPILAEAQNAGVLAPPGPYASQWFNSSAFVLPVILPSPVLNGCQQPLIPNAAFRLGDFASTP